MLIQAKPRNAQPFILMLSNRTFQLTTRYTSAVKYEVFNLDSHLIPGLKTRDTSYQT